MTTVETAAEGGELSVRPAGDEDATYHVWCQTLLCGETSEFSRGDVGPARSWAVQHLRAHPQHQVMQTTRQPLRAVTVSVSSGPIHHARPAGWRVAVSVASRRCRALARRYADRLMDAGLVLAFGVVPCAAWLWAGAHHG